MEISRGVSREEIARKENPEVKNEDKVDKVGESGLKMIKNKKMESKYKKLQNVNKCKYCTS
jgi:hypothetical protein